MNTGVLLTIDDRTDEFAVLELPDEATALVGSKAWITWSTTQKLVGKHDAKRVLMY